jgi:integrase
MDTPIFLAYDGKEPSSATRMTRRFKQYAMKAGLPGHVISYSMRSGFVRDLFAREIPDETVKKLLHHTPRSTDARRHYEGDLTNQDIIALRANLPRRAPVEMDKLNKIYMLM